MTFAEGITLGIIGTCLTTGGWVFVMWLYTKNKDNEEKKKKAQNEFKKVWKD